MTAREASDEIDLAASRWVARLDRRATAEDLAALDAWLAGDPRRRGAYARAQAAWALVLGDRQSTPATMTGFTPSSGVSRRQLAGFGAVGVAAVAGLWIASRDPGAERYATKLGEIRRVPLTDGSRVAINTQSRMDVYMDRRKRSVRLQEGEAWFEVAKDSSRPFVVQAGELTVRAVGTAFSIVRQGAGAQLIVTEGIVDAWCSAGRGRPVRLAEGAKATLQGGVLRTAAVSVEDIDRTLSWRDGHILLDGTTLEDAAAEFNRYNATPIVVTDRRLGAIRLVGYFQTNDPEGFARSISRTLKARVESNGGRIVISPA